MVNVKEYITLHNFLFVCWVVWLTVGSCFYMENLDLNFGEGFYMAVNIGYSIGWGDIPEIGHRGSQWFSTVYVLVGASFVGAALGLFAEYIVADRDDWYDRERQELIYAEKTKDCPWYARIFHFIWHHRLKLRPIVLWIIFVIIATISAWKTNEEFDFTNSLYFAVSSLSTGGHYSLPLGNKEWIYGMTGFYCAIGVPLMGMAMATIASFFINVGSIEETLQDIKKPVTALEIEMLTEFGLADEDGEIDKSEFIILCMVRIGAASPELIKLIEQYFNELDDDNSGTLSIEEILRNRDQANNVANKLLDLVSHEDEIEKDNNAIQQIAEEQKKVMARRRGSSVVASTLAAALEHIDFEVDHAVQLNPMANATENHKQEKKEKDDDENLA